MKQFLFSIVFAFVATFVTAQDCGYSLFNLIAERMNVPATELTVTEFRAEATKLGAAYGIIYDKSGRNNVAIIQAVCAELSSVEDATNTIIADWTRMAGALDTPSVSNVAQVSGVDVTSMKEVINVYTHKNNSELYTTTVYADGSFKTDTATLTTVTVTSTSDTTGLDFLGFSVFYADGVAYDTIFHDGFTDVIPVIQATSIPVCDTVDHIGLKRTQFDSKRILLISDLGHHPEQSTLLELFYFTRNTRRDQIGFRNIWHDLVRMMNAQGIMPWGEAGEPYREHYNTSVAAWEWLSWNKNDWYTWILENGDNITVIQETKSTKETRIAEIELRNSIINRVNDK